MIINIKEAAPSLGKTYGAALHIKSNNEKYIIAAISKELGLQTYKLFKSLGVEDILIINSETRYINGVVGRFLEAVEDNEARIIIVTHKLLEMTYKQGYNFQDWNLLIDEVPNSFIEVTSFEQYSEDETTIIQQFITNTGVKVAGAWVREIYRLKQGVRRKLEERLEHMRKSKDSSLRENVLDAYEYLLLGGAIQRWQDEKDPNKCRYMFLKVLNPLELFKPFKSTTLIAANIENTMIGQMWTKIFKVTLEDSKDIKLRYNKIPNTNKITIYPMLEGADLSRNLLDKNESSNFELMLQEVHKIVGDEEYIYSFNNYRDRNLPMGERIPVITHGLNKFSEIHSCVCLFSYNPNKFTRDLLVDLAEHFKLPEDTFVNAYLTSYYLEYTFQAVSRVSIRNHTSTHPVKLIVGDKKCAEYLKATWFDDATIDYSHKITLPEPEKVGRKGGFPNEFNFSSSERSWFYRQQKPNGLFGRKLEFNNKDDYDIAAKAIKDKRRE